MEFIRAGARPLSDKGETLNVSSNGVLISDPAEPLEIGQPIEYLISLPTGRSIGDVRLRCVGKVIRHNTAQNTFAASLERYEFVRASTAAR
ncbi:MAG: PilZ domain-containing protein [Acidobacteria bacterium]|nr:PilZ domain-containing protein [Acidobacteriota bacterium]